MSPHVTVPTILAHVPVWAWLLLIWLIYQGLCATRDRARPVARVFILPVVFVVWGLVGLLLGGADLNRCIAWLALAALCALPGFRLAPDRAQIDPARHLVILRGSAWPLVRNVGLFGVKFALAVAIALDPHHRADLGLISVAISGAMAGYFLGWGGALLVRYRKAERQSNARSVNDVA